MAQKIIAGAVAYRENKGITEWFVLKYQEKETWELPKSDVKSGESSVAAILRYMKESLGMRASILEEAGRANATVSQGGSPLEQKLVFYIIQDGGKATAEEMAGNSTNPSQRSVVKAEGLWVSYPAVKKRLNLVREQKMITQAQEYLKECRKAEAKKKKIKVH